MSSAWRFPKIWINATLGWIAKVIYEGSDRPWLKSLFGTKSLSPQDKRSVSAPAYFEHEDHEQIGKGKQTALSDNNPIQSSSEHELEFLNQFTDVFPDLDFSHSSSNQFTNSHDLDDHQLDSHEPYSLSYADQLLVTDEDLSFEDLDHQFNQELSAESIDHLSQTSTPNQQTINFNLQDLASSQTRLMSQPLAPQGTTKIKLYDEEREKRRAERRKKRRKQEKKRRRERRSKRKNKTEAEAQYLSNNLETSDRESIDEPIKDNQQPDHSDNNKQLNTWRRPPLRSLSKWERMGLAQMSQWQRYSPSSKALLFGSWFASLESLVEVDNEMRQEREQFYQLVESHEEFSSFSATELDAWWFQLNRVDYFVTEYQFHKKLEKQSRSLLTPVGRKALISEAAEITENESTPELESFDIQISVDLPEIQTFSPQLSQGEPKHFEQNERTPYHTSLSHDSSQSIDSESNQAKEIEEDIILRPIKKRKRKRRSKR